MSIFKKLRTRSQERENHLRELKRGQLFLKIKEVIVKEIKVEDKEQIKLTTRFKEDLSIDSLETIELTMGLEDAFGIELPDEDVEKMFTIQDVIDYLEKKV